MKITTLNIKGLSDSLKRSAYFTWLLNSAFDIICLIDVLLTVLPKPNLTLGYRTLLTLLMFLSSLPVLLVKMQGLKKQQQIERQKEDFDRSRA